MKTADRKTNNMRYTLQAKNNMFKIDLLKGQGIPMKSGPEGIAIAAITFAVPIIIAISMFGYYLHTKIVISVQKREITNYETKMKELSDAVELQKSFEKEKKITYSSLSEVRSSIGRHLQWSPILETLVTNMPDSVVLTKLEAKQRTVRKKIPQKNNPKETTEISVPSPILHMSVYGSVRYNCDKAVRDFRDHLRFSTVLGPKLEDIRVSQVSNTLQGQDVVSYEIDCIFKPPL